MQINQVHRLQLCCEEKTPLPSGLLYEFCTNLKIKQRIQENIQYAHISFSFFLKFAKVHNSLQKGSITYGALSSGALRILFAG